MSAVMKKLRLLLIIWAVSTSIAQAQSDTRDFCDTGSYHIRLYLRNDSLVVRCDTVYLLNPATFMLYSKTYNSFRTGNADQKKLVSTFSELQKLYENRIAQQDTEYVQLKAQFDSLVNNSQTYIQKSSTDLNQLNISLKQINENVKGAKQDVTESKELIRQEIRKSTGSKLRWGLGGFGIGITVTAILFAAFN
jgi:hypothetical protein